jgi:hypothetical protein
LLLLNLLDGSDTVIRINNLLADFEAHRSTSIEFEKIRLRRTRGSGGNPSDAVSAGPYVVSEFESTTALAKRQAVHRVDLGK